MAFLYFCQACQFGDHEAHVDVPESAPDGMIGGWVCPCEGECVKMPPADRYTANGDLLVQMRDAVNG